jgi:hypothetical protein
VREIRTLHAMWPALETEPRRRLPGNTEGNVDTSQEGAYSETRPTRLYGTVAPALDPTSGRPIRRVGRQAVAHFLDRVRRTKTVSKLHVFEPKRMRVERRADSPNY